MEPPCVDIELPLWVLVPSVVELSRWLAVPVEPLFIGRFALRFPPWVPFIDPEPVVLPVPIVDPLLPLVVDVPFWDADPFVPLPLPLPDPVDCA